VPPTGREDASQTGQADGRTASTEGSAAHHRLTPIALRTMPGMSRPTELSTTSVRGTTREVCQPRASPISSGRHLAAAPSSPLRDYLIETACEKSTSAMTTSRRSGPDTSPSRIENGPHAIIQADSQQAPALCEWVLPDGRMLRFPTSTDPQVVAALLRAAEAR